MPNTSLHLWNRPIRKPVLINDVLFVAAGFTRIAIAVASISDAYASGAGTVLELRAGQHRLPMALDEFQRCVEGGPFVRIHTDYSINLAALDWIGESGQTVAVAGKCFPLASCYRHKLMSRLIVV